MNRNTIELRLEVKDNGSVVIKKFTGGGVKDLQKLQETSTTMTQKMGAGLGQLRSHWLKYAAAIGVAYAASRKIFRLYEKAFDIIEQTRLSTAALASLITTFSDRAKAGDLAGAYREAYDYAEALVLKTEELNTRTLMGAKGLYTMVETMAQYGVLLDTNNTKQTQGFLALANALAIVTQGMNQEVQIRQEVRALMTGQTRATDQLGRLIKNIVGEDMEKQLTQWREQGVLIENVGALLTGFQAGTKDLASTWMAIKSTMETIQSKILRGALTPMYEYILETVQKISGALIDQEGQLTPLAQQIQEKLLMGWLGVKGAIEGIWPILKEFVPVVGKIVEWGGYLGYVILPVVLERAHSLLETFIDIGKMLYSMGEAVYYILAGDINRAWAAWEEAEGNWATAGEHAAEAFAGGFSDKIAARKAQWDAILQSIRAGAGGAVTVPKVSAPSGIDAEAKKALAAYEKLYAQVIARIKELTLEEKDYKLWQLGEWYRESVAVYEKAGKETVTLTQLYWLERDAIIKEFNEKEAAERQKLVEQWREAEKAITRDLMTEKERRKAEIMEEFEARKLQLDLFLRKGIITEEAYTVVVERAAEARKNKLAELEEAEKGYLVYIEEMNKQTALNIQQSWSGLLSGVMKGEFESFEDWLNSFLNSLYDTWADTLAKMAYAWVNDFVSKLSTSGTGAGGGTGEGGFNWGGLLSGLLTGIVGALQHGGVVHAGRILPFGYGGVVTQPTVFPMANGNIGLMGEKDWEAVMPLARTPKGELGVKAAEGGKQTVVNGPMVQFNITTPDADSFRKTQGQLMAEASLAVQRGMRNT
jgi:hypothetical protein